MSHHYGVPLRISSLSVTGGMAKVHEFGVYLRDLDRGRLGTPDVDVIVVATDGNCKGHTARKQEIERVAEGYPALVDLVVYAIPAPHIERWLLADPAAFKVVLGRGCNLPQHKCEKDYYKQILVREVQASGVKPILGELEYAQDIIEVMDLSGVEASEPSFGKFFRDLKAKLNQWREH